MNSLFDCNTCRLYPCTVIKQGAEMEAKGYCPVYKTDLDKLIIEQNEQFKEYGND